MSLQTNKTNRIHAVYPSCIRWAFALGGLFTLLASLLVGSARPAQAGTVHATANSIPTISSIPAQSMDEDTQLGPLPFTVGDEETAPGLLQLFVRSSNTTLFPSDGLILGGSGANRTITLIPAEERSGSALITLIVSDGAATAQTFFLVTVNPVLDPPTISGPGDQATESGLAVGPLQVTVHDVDTPLAALVLSATASDAVLLPPSAFVFGGSDGTRTVTITPAPHATGTAIVTLTVSDGNSSASVVFSVTVIARNQPPTIAAIGNQQMAEDTTINLTFVVTDTDTPSDDLVYTVASSSPVIVPNANLSLGGNGPNRTLSITPAPDQYGVVIITITVSDGEFTITHNFTLTVMPVEDPPTIEAIPSQRVVEGTSLDVSLTITDIDTPIRDLSILGVSTDMQLVPDENIVVVRNAGGVFLRITPALGHFGATVILVTVSDGTHFAVASFQLLVTKVNNLPTVVPFANQRIDEDAVFGPFAFAVEDLDSPANVLTVTATASNVDLIHPENIFVAGSGGSRMLTITPTVNAFGSSFVTIWVGDGEGVGSFTFTLFVDSVNDTPELDDLPDVSTPEDTPIAVPVRARDVETPSDRLFYAAIATNFHLVPGINLQFTHTVSESLLHITPAPDMIGTTRISVTVGDGQRSVTKGFRLTVVDINDSPLVTTPPDLVAIQGISVTTYFTVTDVDTPLNALTITASSSNTELFPTGSLRLGGNGSPRWITLTPAPGKHGVATITIVVDDGEFRVPVAFKVTVFTAPTISAIPNQSTDEDVALTVPFVLDDPDTNLQLLQLSAATSNPQLIPLNRITFGGSGGSRTMTILPAPNLYGTARLTVTVSDGTLSSFRSFTLTVRPVNDPPTIAPIAQQQIDEGDTGTVTIVLADVDDDPSSLQLSAASSDTTLISNDALLFSGTGATRLLSLTGTVDRSGSSTITLTVSDGEAETTITFVVKVNGRPSLYGLSDVVVAEDSAETISFTVSDPEQEYGNLRITAVSGNTALIRNETLLLGGSGTDRTLRIRPEPDGNGTATVTVSADDGRLRTSFTFLVTVQPVNDRPAIGTIADQMTNEDVPTGPISFAVNDVDNSLAELALSGSSSNPTLLPHTNIVFGGEGINRTIKLTPAPDLHGSAVITVTVSDGLLLASTSFRLTVLPVNDPPVIAPVPRQISPEDTPITVTFQISDIDSPVDNITISASSSNQELVRENRIQAGGSGDQRLVTITPELNQHGTVTITLKASDGNLIGEQSFVLVVTPVNDAPTLEIIPDQWMDEDTVLAVGLTLDDADTPLTQLQVSVDSGDLRIVHTGGYWSEGLGNQRTLYIQPAKDRNGLLPMTVSVGDGQYVSVRTFWLTVRPMNDPPVAVNDHARVFNTPSVNLGVLANDWDMDGDALQVVSVSPGAYGAASVNSDNTIRYLMPAGFAGTEVLEYTIDDGHGERASAQLTIVVVDRAAGGAAAIHSVEPRQGANDNSVEIVITGVHFTGLAQAFLGPYPLLNVQVADASRIRTTIPAFLPPGRYDLIVKLADGDTLVQRDYFLVTTPGLVVSEVRPARSVQSVPLLINVYGINFLPDSQVLLDEQALETYFLSSTHLQAMLPAYPAPPGVYPVTVRRPDGIRATQVEAFTVQAENGDDLFAYPFEMWSNPATLYVGQSVLIGLNVHRQGGGQVALDVPVAFYNGEPSQQTYLGRAIVAMLEANDRDSTQPLTWVPSTAGSHTIYAVIDPDNRLPEVNEENNVLKRAVTVLPTVADMMPPTVDKLLLRAGADTTDSQDITVQVAASDGGAGVRSIFLVEYEYARGAGNWTPVQWSGWLDYQGTPTTYQWRLLPSPGVRYIYAWVADNAGNISTRPQAALINYVYADDDVLEGGEIRLYRYSLQTSEQMLAFVIPNQGDPDIYIWPPDSQSRGPWVTNLRDVVDEIGFVAPVSGVYQLEISGFTPSIYRTVVEVRAGGPRVAPANNSNLDPTKPLRETPFVAVEHLPFARYALPLGPQAALSAPPAPVLQLFLPAVQR